MTSERQYMSLLREAATLGVLKEDRTGTGTRSLFGRQMRFDLGAGFPLLTTKRVYWRGVVEELLWMLRGETNVQSLKAAGVHIWDPWTDEDGELGPVYGAQWRNWWTTGAYGEPSAVDQIADVTDRLRTDPDSRRLIVSAWNVGDLEDMALPPCHLLFQFYSRPLDQRERARLGREAGWEVPQFGTSTPEEWDRLAKPLLDEAGLPVRALDCQLYQRSGDLFLGVPFNIAGYSLLLVLMAEQTDHLPGDFVHTLGDAHLYLNHVEQAWDQLARSPRPLPVVRVADKPWMDLRFQDIVLSEYNPHPRIPAPVAV